MSDVDKALQALLDRIRQEFPHADPVVAGAIAARIRARFAAREVAARKPEGKI